MRMFYFIAGLVVGGVIIALGVTWLAHTRSNGILNGNNAGARAANMMDVTLQIPNRAEFVYPLTTDLADTEMVSDKQLALHKEIDDKTELGDPKKVEVIVTEGEVTIDTPADTETAAKAQLVVLDAAMKNVFGKGNFTEPDAAKVFIPVGPADQASVRDIMTRRLRNIGLTQVTARNLGSDMVELQISGVKDRDQVHRLITVTGHMEFRLIPAGYQVSVDKETGEVTATHGSKDVTPDQIVKLSTLVLPGSALKPTCDVVSDPGNPSGMAVSFSFDTKNDRDHFAQVTGFNVGRQLAIVLDGVIITAPVIQSKIPRGGIITGSGDAAEAKELSVMLNSGTLEAPVTVVEKRDSP